MTESQLNGDVRQSPAGFELRLRSLEKQNKELDERIRELDNILRGERGDNGLASDLRILAESDARRTWRERTIVGLLLVLMTKEFWAVFIGTP